MTMTVTAILACESNWPFLMQKRVFNDVLKKCHRLFHDMGCLFKKHESQISADVLSDITEHLWDIQIAVKEYFPPVVDDSGHLTDSSII